MAIDTIRWQRLRDKIAQLEATNRAYNDMLSSVEARRNRLAIELDQAKDAHRRAPPVRVNWASAMQDSDERRAAELEPLRAELREVESEMRRLDTAQAASFQRLSALRRLEAECRKWAQEAGVALPGEPHGPSGAVLQRSPGARFGGAAAGGA